MKKKQHKKIADYSLQEIWCYNHDNPVIMDLKEEKLTFTLKTQRIYVCPKCSSERKILGPNIIDLW
jgi:Zn finger protein HypA/HybF involved in hydrogenase expression